MPRARSDAGAAAPLDRRWLRRRPLPSLAIDGDKEARGQVLIIGGAPQMPGPIILAATAAMRAGAGKLQIATVAAIAPLVATAMPEAFVHAVAQRRRGSFAHAAVRTLAAAAADAAAILIGPGMVAHPQLRRLVAGVLADLTSEQDVVLDAGGLTCFGGSEATGVLETAARVIGTPHAGEAAALLGRDKAAIRRAPREAAAEAARRIGGLAVLKGRETWISDGRTTVVNRLGNVGLATSGSGDVLAGLIAGLAARGAAPLVAAGWGVHLHAAAGDVLAAKVGPVGYLARELAAEVPALMSEHGPRRG